MKITTDPTEYMNARLDTPIGPPSDRAARRALQPGTCVKSNTLKIEGRSTQAPPPFDYVCGIVQSNEPFNCVVVGHGVFDTPESKFVWSGTQGEFQETWVID